ncbi:thiamine-phosphate kinase [Sphingomonas sp. BIUV-7]|uniref:Thiamine-monophosphate kinase n=1 Tax=Sphingomonas natans TaxID=3063330 RepID=A0ABT8YE78_9SPHN|nr:thiamine-phosphate kinase [Sphingomonas sp. BIUV-7]MDO6416621.1 thiamine-phosphate kinase [Sphingomonas sp. BIUV-7]
MSRESIFIAALRGLARDPAARDLIDDAAVLTVGGTALVLTHDMIVEGVHYLPADPPEDVAWKLVAVNLSDLAAKGARPIGVLLGYALGEDEWNLRFVAGLRDILAHYDVPLLGGDTVAGQMGTPRMLGLTAIGEAPAGGAPSRTGAQIDDICYVTGAIGAAGIGLAVALGERSGPASALAAYRRPVPRLAEGRVLAPHINAMMDVSDGLLIDAMRMAQASGIGLTIDLDAVPLAPACPDDQAGRIAAASAGDDYELLFAAPVDAMLPSFGDVAITAIGRFQAEEGFVLIDRDGPVELPTRLGYEHGA